MIEKREIIVLISRKKYSPRSFYFHHKTTACFTKNNGSFYRKQRLVLQKTTARFTENNGSFYRKQRLVLPKTTALLPKTTACFAKNDGSFTKNNGSFYQKRRVVLPKTTGCFYTKKSKCRSFCSNFVPCPPPYFALTQAFARKKLRKHHQFAQK